MSESQVQVMILTLKMKYRMRYLLQLIRGPQGSMQMRVCSVGDSDDTKLVRGRSSCWVSFFLLVAIDGA